MSSKSIEEILFRGGSSKSIEEILTKGTDGESSVSYAINNQITTQESEDVELKYNPSVITEDEKYVGEVDKKGDFIEPFGTLMGLNPGGDSTPQDMEAYYTFLNEDVSDNSGNNFDFGTPIPSGLSFVKNALGVDNSAILFNNSEYMESGDITFTGSIFSFSLCFYLTAKNKDNPFITTDFWDSNNAAGYKGAIFGVNSSNKIYLAYGDGGSPGSSSRRSFETNAIDFTLNEWYHVVGIVDSPTSARIYLNNISQSIPSISGTGSAANWNPSYSFKIGMIHSNGGRLSGGLSDIRLYDRAISQSEAENIYNKDFLGSSTSQYYDANEVDIANGKKAYGIAVAENIVLLKGFIRKDSIFGDNYSKNTSLFITDTKTITNKIPVGKKYQPLGVMYDDNVANISIGEITETDEVGAGGSRLDIWYSNSQNGATDTISPTGKKSDDTYIPAQPAKKYKYTGFISVFWTAEEGEPLAESFTYTDVTFSETLGESMNVDAGVGKGGELADRPTGSDRDKYFDALNKNLYEKITGTWTNVDANYTTGQGYSLTDDLTTPANSGRLYIKDGTSWSDPIPFGKGEKGDSVTAEFDGYELIMKNATTGTEISRQNVRGATGADSTVPGPQGDNAIYAVLQKNTISFKKDLNGDFTPSIPTAFNVELFSGSSKVEPDNVTIQNKTSGFGVAVGTVGISTPLTVSNITADYGEFTARLTKDSINYDVVFTFSVTENGQSAEVFKLLALNGLTIREDTNTLRFQGISVDGNGNQTLLLNTEFRIDVTDSVTGQRTELTDFTIQSSELTEYSLIELKDLAGTKTYDTLTATNMTNILGSLITGLKNKSDLTTVNNGHIYLCSSGSDGSQRNVLGKIWNNGILYWFEGRTTPKDLYDINKIPSGDFRCAIYFDVLTEDFYTVYYQESDKTVREAVSITHSSNPVYISDEDNHKFIGYCFKDGALWKELNIYNSVKTPNEATEELIKKSLSLQELDPIYKSKVDGNESNVASNLVKINSNTLRSVDTETNLNSVVDFDSGDPIIRQNVEVEDSGSDGTLSAKISRLNNSGNDFSGNISGQINNKSVSSILYNNNGSIEATDGSSMTTDNLTQGTNKFVSSSEKTQISDNSLHRDSKNNPHDVTPLELSIGFSCRGFINVAGSLPSGVSFNSGTGELIFDNTYFTNTSGYSSIYTMIRPKIWRRTLAGFIDVDSVKDYILIPKPSDINELSQFKITNVPIDAEMFFDICVYEKP